MEDRHPERSKRPDPPADDNAHTPADAPPAPRPPILRTRRPRASGRKGFPTEPTIYPDWTRDLDPISGLRLRRAVLRTLLRAGGPLSLDEILTSLRTVDRVYMTGFPGFDERHKLSDLLGHQVRCGRVRRVGRGRFEIDVASLSATNRWRIEHWDRLGPTGRLGR